MRIILCVTNDIATDRRINRIALSLMQLPADVLVIGRSFRNSMALPAFQFQTHRIRMVFRKGPLFYAEYNLRLFFHLLFKNATILVANDLDTLPAVFLAAGIRRLTVVYDSHEYFTEVPELVGRKWVKRAWEGIEAILLPRVKYASTVSESIAKEYRHKYGISLQVVRNLPFRVDKKLQAENTLRKADEKIIVFQGSLNMGRGLELAIKSMQFLNNTRLVIVGTGDIENELHELTASLFLQEKVLFTGRVSPDELLHITAQADLGISIEENLGLNYYYALPNKLFDYIQARIPVLVSDLPEMAAIVRKYQIGKVSRTHAPYELAMELSQMLEDREQQSFWQKNLEKAAVDLCWENEEPLLLNLYHEVLTHKR